MQLSWSHYEGIANRELSKYQLSLIVSYIYVQFNKKKKTSCSFYSVPLQWLFEYNDHEIYILETTM